MKIISCYIREQCRYTKNQLRSMLSFNEPDVEKFIKSLKSYGVLKTVANNAEQRQLTDLVEDDVEIVDETAANGDCLYVFTFVGVITYGNRVLKIFPKYLRSHETPLSEMTQIMKVLERYSHSEEQIIRLFNGEGENRKFNLLAVILYLLNDYFEYGVYNNDEEVIEVNGEGSIIWQRTIDDGFALIEDNKPFYIEVFTRKTIDDDFDYFKRLHECVLTECSQQLQDAGLEDLFEMEPVTLSEDAIENFGDKEYILERILSELSIQFNTHKQLLLKSLYTYIAQDHKMLENDQSMSMYGTTAFHKVWETACSEVFNDKLHTPIGHLVNPVAPGYDSKTKLIDLIEHPQWIPAGSSVGKDAKDTLIPDTITIGTHQGQRCFFIFDAKYYLLQLEDSKPLQGNPGVGDVTKQYLYQLAYKNFVKEHGISVTKNCFLMPTESAVVEIAGKVRLDMLSGLGLEDIDIRLLPARTLFTHYLASRKMSLDELKL